MTRSPGVAFMPRFNFAWSVRDDGDLVLRGGAGLFYNRPQGNYQYFAGTMPPNVYNTNAYYYDVPGGLTLGSLPTIDPWSHLGTSYVDSLDARSIHLPRTWTWSLAVAKRLPWQQSLDVAYVGNRGDHLPNRTFSSYVPPGALTGTYGNADLDNPLHRAALDSSVVAAFRTFPAYAGSWWYQYEALVELPRAAGVADPPGGPEVPVLPQLHVQQVARDDRRRLRGHRPRRLRPAQLRDPAPGPDAHLQRVVQPPPARPDPARRQRLPAPAPQRLAGLRHHPLRERRALPRRLHRGARQHGGPPSPGTAPTPTGAAAATATPGP